METLSVPSEFSTQPSPASSPGLLPWDKVVFADAPAWFFEQAYDATVPARPGEHSTQLLLSQHECVGTGVSVWATAMRFETSLAVQNQSQWSVQFDPRTQVLTLHWLRIVRGGRRIDHLRRERLRLIQREEQLEFLSVDGFWTLLTILDDVRPGDIIEAGYSITDNDPIWPRQTEVFFSVPPHVVVGRYCLSLTAGAANAPLAWKASPGAPALREETTPSGDHRRVWEGAQLTPGEPEFNQPASALDYIWIQASDHSSWRTMAGQVVTAWERQNDVAGLAEISALARPDTPDAAAVCRLVEYIQDEFRYLSINLENGGRIPATPATIVRRRYGDCKDLAWLATTVLRSWGLQASPVLVNAHLCEKIAGFLPMRRVFNHAIVEVSVDGKTRWFDLTARHQGGSFDARPVAWFGRGLLIDPTAKGLGEQPGAPSAGLYSLKETILPDTRQGTPSLVELRLRTEGHQADELRRARHLRGAEDFKKEREYAIARRYGRARRMGALHWRDDRAANRCELVEVFEITDHLRVDDAGQRALFAVPPCLVSQIIPIPDDKARGVSWAIPFPLEIRHEIAVKSSSMANDARKNRQWQDAFFFATLDEPRMRGVWSKITTFKTKAREVPASEVLEYRRQLEKFMSETVWQVGLPLGLGRSHRGSGFGEFPRGRESAPAVAQSGELPDQPEPAAKAQSASDAKIDSGIRRRRRSEPPPPRLEFILRIPALAWPFIWCALCGVALVALRACVHGGR